MHKVVSFSGGKDSTALLLRMIEEGMHIDDIVFCDTGMEFQQMYDHIEKVEKYIGRKVTRLEQDRSYEYYLSEHPLPNGKIGYGHPDFKVRWCTGVFKREPFLKYINGKKKPDGSRQMVIEYHGIALDEAHRAENNQGRGRIIDYPLIRWGMTEADCLQYCYDKGFDWDGLYESFERVSCWCCPLSRIKELRVLYNEYPHLWDRLIELDKRSHRQFKERYSIEFLTERFRCEKEGLPYEKVMPKK